MDAMVHACLKLMEGERRRLAVGDPSKYDFQLTQDIYALGNLMR
jgi:hypothetical protein